MNLLIHFQPGARGDFLASILLDSWNETLFGKLSQPKYKKIHHINHHGYTYTWDQLKNFPGIKIHIDAGKNAYNLLLIQLNNFRKNTRKTTFDLVDYDLMYRAACYFVSNEYNEILDHKHFFDYWIKFEELYDVNFLKELYYRVTAKILSTELIVKNLQQQPIMDNQLRQLVLLLQFEIDNDLILNEKYFNMLQNLNFLENFLDSKYYSDKKIEKF